VKKKIILSASFLAVVLCSSLAVNAKVWRINNNPGISRDFAEVSTAVASSSVQNGDTLYIEPSATAYASLNLTKRLVFMGSGYLLTENTGLQVNPNESIVSSIYLDSLSSGSVFSGIRVTTFATNSNTDNITFSRCYLPLITISVSFPNSRMSGWILNKCYAGMFQMNSSGFIFENLQVTNCLFTGSFATFGNNNSLIRNNLFMSTVNTSNAYVSNNIFLNGWTLVFTNSTVKNNIATGNVLVVGNGNQNNILLANLFVGTGSSDGKYQLKPGSPAIGAGETVNGITPDCGPFGTDDPYRLSGIPPIPSIYSLNVPSSVPTSATSIPVTVSTRSNN
jgi:hypothetical protein